MQHYSRKEMEVLYKLELPDFSEDINGRPLRFSDNGYLKPEGASLALTQEHIEEWVRCRDDIWYFAEKYYKIVDLDEGLIKIKLRDYQQDIIDKFMDYRFVILNCSRQIGKCTFDSTIKIRNKKTGEVKEIKIDDFYEMMAKRRDGEVL